jgi:uncharacterized protein
VRIRRLAAVPAVALVLLAAGGAVASAHVTVDAPGATSGGGDQIINVRVPTESDTASTVKLDLQLPASTPIASVLVQPTPGWSVVEQNTKLSTPITTDDGTITEAVSEITWTATAGGTPPGQFEQFTLIAGQLPDASSITFKAIQTYSDGSVVSWIETPAPGSSAEPDHPAPVLSLAAASGDSTSSSSSKTSNTVPIVLSIVALVLGAAALGVAVVGRAKRAA